MNKIKFLKFDSLCLLDVYLLTVIFDYIYEMYGGKNCRYFARVLFIKIAFKKLSTVCLSVRRQQPPSRWSGVY